MTRTGNKQWHRSLYLLPRKKARSMRLKHYRPTTDALVKRTRSKHTTQCTFGRIELKVAVASAVVPLPTLPVRASRTITFAAS